MTHAPTGALAGIPLRNTGYSVLQFSKLDPLEEVVVGFSYCSLTGAALGQPPTCTSNLIESTGLEAKFVVKHICLCHIRKAFVSNIFLFFLTFLLNLSSASQQEKSRNRIYLKHSQSNMFVKMHPFFIWPFHQSFLEQGSFIVMWSLVCE